MPVDEKRMASFRFSPHTHEQLEALAAKWHCDKTAVVAHGLDVLADRKLSSVLGGQPQSAEQALHCWSAVIEAASRDNDLTFARREWNLIADANNGCSPLIAMAGEDCRVGSSPTLLWANVADDIKLNGGDAKWGVKDPTGLVKRLRALDFVHGWAAVLSVQWFWEHANCPLDHEQDAWWTVAFRRAHRCAGQGEE